VSLSMRALVVSLVALALVLSAHATDYHGKQWQSKSAADKFTVLKKGVGESTKTAGYPGIAEQAALFVEGMPLSFDTTADDMPKELLGLVTRRKLVHSVGLMGTATWTPVTNTLGYTGIFASGSQQLMVRLSSGNQPTETGNNSAMIPAVAFKFLRDGVPSGNIHALGAGPQSSFNFFLHDFSNHVPDLPFSAPIGPTLLRDLFATASMYPTWVGLSKIAETDATGKKPTGTPNYPWRLIFHPTTALHTAYPDSNPGVLWYKQLASSIKPGPLFTVWAIDAPQNDNKVAAAVQIATVTLTSTFTESYFGDRTLFYQHTSLEDDIKLKPAWKTIAATIQQWQRNQTTQYSYPDLPWTN